MKKKRKKLGLFSFVLLLIFIVSSIAAIFLLWNEVQKELSIIELEKETIENYVIQTPENSEEPQTEENMGDTNGYQFDWNGMKSVNNDVIGWIRFDNPERISYPIVQTNNNQFYLTHDWRGYYQFAGAIFLSKSNQPNFTDANSVIYGHRMIGGSMFGDLGKYSSQTFMDENPYFYIYTPDGVIRTYEIFAYSEVIDGSNAYDTAFETVKDRSNYFQTIKNQAIASRDIPLTEYDTTVTLSTCANYGYYNRMILEGKLVKIHQNYSIPEQNGGYSLWRCFINK